MNGARNSPARLNLEKNRTIPVNNKVCCSTNSCRTDLMFVENNHTLQFRPSIPRRPSPGRLPASHNLLLTSQIHNHQDMKLPTHLIESDFEHDESIDNAINSHSLSNHSLEQSTLEVSRDSRTSIDWICLSLSLSRVRPIRHRRSQFDRFIAARLDAKAIVCSTVVLIWSYHPLGL